jgi:hypothetical protein
MIALSTAAVPFTPPWSLDQGGAPLPDARTYLVRPGTVADRAMFEGAISGPPWNAGRVFPWDLLNAAERAVMELLDGHSQALVLDALNANRDNLATPEQIPAHQAQLLAGVEIALRSWPEYAELRAAESRRTHILPMLSAKWFLVGWQGIDAPFTTDRDGKASDAALAAIPSHDLNAIGWHAYNLMHAEQHRPLSKPPLKSGAARPRSTTGGSRQRAKVGG